MEYGKLHLETVTPLLYDILQFLMREPLFDSFRLVGGTNLSLRYGHRHSVDIDLFTDAPYDSIDFGEIEEYLVRTFPYCDIFSGPVGFGKMYYIGTNPDQSIKLDLMYTETFLDPEECYGRIRMASPRDIAAMKLEAVATGGRKKDIWDIDYLAENVFSLDQMCNFHAKRHPYSHERIKLLESLKFFEEMDMQADPVCLMNKDWADIKLSTISRANSSIFCHTKLLSQFSTGDFEILESTPIYTNKTFIGHLCRYSVGGKPLTAILI